MDMKDVYAALDTFAQGGKKPTEVAKQITDLTAQVGVSIIKVRRHA